MQVNGNAQTIFDLGCHMGEDSDLYLRKGFQVVAVEANPTLANMIKSKFSEQINRGQFTLVEKAIAETEGTIDFYVNSRSTILGTIRNEWADRDDAEYITKITVPSTRFSSLILNFGLPYYLKIDIEGADLLCLEELQQFADKPKFISFESNRRSISSLKTEIGLLKKLGYTKFQLVDQKKVPDQTPPFPAREGAYVDCSLMPGSSGLFGRDLPGIWLSTPAFVVRYLQVLAADRLAGLAKRIGMRDTLRGSWYDIHATT